MFEHNYEMCNCNGFRCVYCCGLNYELGKEYYDCLFSERKDLFDLLVHEFPDDLTKFVAEVKEEQNQKINICYFIGLVDDNPGCMIHPLIMDGMEVRDNYKLAGKVCWPEKGCHYNLYFRTEADMKLFYEFVKDTTDWFSYSKALSDAADFNRRWAYIISRTCLENVSIAGINEIVDKIHSGLNSEFHYDNGPVAEMYTCGEDLVRGFKKPIFPTEKFMIDSNLFVTWGLDFRKYAFEMFCVHLESRFSKHDVDEWGYFFGDRQAAYIFRPFGEVLPINFTDVAITSNETLERAIEIINEVVPLSSEVNMQSSKVLL